ncbi:UNVERIFIED_CONTAM: hypothetical protein PYX00_005154 [Menopon gallinae]|uniref:EH domain-containing protein n=1 Tax=Menopon gallinae TaxID=328185 RepID=A0AAW2HQV1_9NEOP
MRSSTAEMNQKDERIKEYHRQQERLKAVTTNSDKIKTMSADVMIENLLKQSFVKPNNATVDNKVSAGQGLPNWLECESAEVPGVYRQLWALVKTNTNFADTQKVSQLLLTSGLQTEVLGYIWNIANRVVPGQLNKQEFYTILALVGLAQSGYTFHNLSVLNLVPTAPIPALQTKVLDKYSRSLNNPYVNHARSFSEESVKAQSLYNDSTYVNVSSPINMAVKDIGESKPIKKPNRSNLKELPDSENSRDFPKMSNFPYIGSSPTAELEDEDDFSEFHSVSISESGPSSHKEDSAVSTQSDDFTDFQCADINTDPLETIVISQKKEIPKIPLPRNLGGKLSNLRTNVLKISPESEKKLKVFSQSETLTSLPESKISTNNKVSTMPNISVLGGNRDVGQRLANHSLGSKSERSKHQRHHKHKQPVHIDDIHFPPKFGTMDELFPKCFQKSSKTFVLKETKIGSVEAESSSSSTTSKYEDENMPDLFAAGKNTRIIEIPMLGTFSETTLPTQSETHIQQPSVELFSLEEDKYSALREVEMEMKMKNTELKQDNPEGTDDFGEFLSAEIPPTSGQANEETDLWGDWKNPNPVSVPDEKFLEFTNNNLENNDSKKQSDVSSALNFDLLSLNVDESSKPLYEYGSDIKSEQCSILEDPFRSITEPIPKLMEENKTNINNDFLISSNSKTEENSVFPSTSQTPSGLIVKDSNDEDFGMFFTSDFNPPVQETIREDLLPSLDLKMLPSEGGEPENIRKKCLTACLNIMQQGIHIINGVKSASVLEEVFSTQEAINYLNNLNIISQISRRVSGNCGEFPGIQDDIDKIWQKFVNYCKEYNIVLNEDVDCNEPVGEQCHVCLGYVGSDGIDQGLTFYHPSCANFWINCIDSELPCPI